VLIHDLLGLAQDWKEGAGLLRLGPAASVGKEGNGHRLGKGAGQ
jgi:hypothetical protein